MDEVRSYNLHWFISQDPDMLEKQAIRALVRKVDPDALVSFGYQVVVIDSRDREIRDLIRAFLNAWQRITFKCEGLHG